MQDLAIVGDFVFLLGPPGPFTDPDAGSLGGGGEGAVLTGAFADPNGNITPSDPTKAAWYYMEGAVPSWWQWNVTDQLWNQGAG